jgi:hypothetical protein
MQGIKIMPGFNTTSALALALRELGYIPDAMRELLRQLGVEVA